MSNFTANSQWFKDYVQSIEIAEFNKERPKRNFKDYRKEQTIASRVENERFMNDFSSLVSLVPEYDYTDELADSKENLLGMFRLNFSEQTERNAARDAKRDELASLVTDEQRTVYDTTQTSIITDLKEATKNNTPLWQVMNPDDFVWKDTGEATTRLYDTTNGYSMSQYTTFTTADTYKSWFGATRRVKMGGAQRLQLNESLADSFRKIATEAKIRWDFEGPIAEANGLTIKQYIDEAIAENPDQWWFFRNIGDLFYTTEQGNQIDGRVAPWNSSMLSERLLSMTDENWTSEGGDRDKLLAIFKMDENEIGPTGIIEGDVRKFIAENPTLIEDLQNSNNGWQFISALNKRKSERVIGNYLTENNNSYGAAGFMNLLGYGFTTDPAIALDIAATVGLTIATGGGYVGVRAAAGVLQIGSKLKFGLSIAKSAKKAKHFKRMVKRAHDGKTVGRYRAASAVGKTLRGIGEATMFSRRLLPTQIVSELFFPSLKFLRHSRAMKKGDDAADAATSWWKYLKNENYLGDSVGRRMLHRSIGGAMEGVVWGSIEYGVMEDYQDRTNSLIFGNDAAAALALDRDRSGAYGHMLMFGVAFGGLGGPLIGETFTQVGKIPQGMMIGGMKMSQWADQVLSPGGQEAMGYAKAPFAKRFGARIVQGTGNAVTWLGGGNQYSVEQQYLMYKALSKISQTELLKMAEADDNGVAMTKVLQDIEDRISKYQWAASEAGLDIREAFKSAEDVMDGKPEKERTSSAFIKQVEDHLEGQEIAARGKAGFRSRVRQAVLAEFQERMRSGQDVGIMEKAMEEADPNNPPSDPEVSNLNKTVTDIQEESAKVSKEREAVVQEQARRKEGLEPDEPARTPEQIEGEFAEQVKLRDEETIAAKTEENNKAKAELKELNKSKRKGVSKKQFKKDNPRVEELETTIRETDKFLADAEEAKKVSIEEAEAKKNAELEEAKKDLQNLSDDELTERLNDLDVILGERLYELESEAYAYWQANPEKFVKYIAYFRKKVLEERLNGDTPNANGMPPMFAAIDGLEVDGAVNMIQLFAPGTYFTRDELIRVRRQLKTEDQRFITAALEGSQDGEFDLTKAEARALTTRIKDILVEEAVNKDYTSEEMRFMNAIINEPSAETIEKAFASTRVETYVNNMMIDAAKNNKVLTADDLMLYNQDPELVIETFVKAKQDLAKLMVEVRDGNYTTILRSQGKNVLDTLGEGVEGYKKSGKGITNKWKADFLAKYFSENEEFTATKAEMLEVFEVNDEFVGPTLQQPARTSEQMDLVKARIKDLLEDVVNQQAEKIKMSEVRARRKRAGYAKQREKTQNAYAKWYESSTKLSNKTKADQDKVVFQRARNKLKEMRDSINKAVDAEWENGTIKADWIARQSKRLDVQYRPNFAHARPLVKVLSMLQAHLLGTARWKRDSLSGFFVDTTITRKDLISILETAEEGYGFIANIDEIAIGARVGEGYDGEKVIQALLTKLKSTDQTLGNVLSAGFEKNLGIHFGKKLPYATDVFGSRGDLRNLMTSLKGQLEGKQAYARGKAGAGEYAGNRGDGNIDEATWNSSFNEEFITRLGYIATEGSQRARNLLAALDGLSPEKQIATALKFINEFIPEGQNKLKSFSQLGGGTEAIDWVGPKRAAQAVLSALSTERPYANKVAESYVVKGERNRPERARRLSNIDEDGIYIQHDSDPIIQRNYERATADHAMNWLLKKLDNPDLDAEARKDIYKKLQAWLENFPEQAVLNDAVRAALPQQGLSFVPRWMVTGPDADIIGKNFGTGIEGQIQYNLAMSKVNTPALMATIHDAIFVGLPSMMTKSGDVAASPSWNFKVGDDHVLRGIGFGFQTLIARKGSFEDALNHVHQIMYGYKGLVEEARASYNTMSQKRVEGLTGKTFDTNDEFVGWMAQEFPKLDTAKKEAIIKELFPALASSYMDADSSGSNIMLALVMGQDTDFGNLWKTIKEADEGNKDVYNEAHSEAVINAYKHVESYVLERIEKRDFNGKAGLEEVYNDLGKVFTVLKDEGLSKEILKSPVMTDSYGIGVAKMKESIIESFGKPSVKEELIKRGLFTEEDYDAKIYQLSDTLATLLSKGVDSKLGGWIKQSLFAKGGLDNKKLGEILNNWRRTESGQRVRTGDEQRSVADSNNFMSDMTSGSTTANFKAGNSEEISMFDNMFDEVTRQISVLAEITGDVESAKAHVNNLVNLITDDLKGDKNVEKLMAEGKFAEAQREIDIAFNKMSEESVMVKALNSYMAQGYGFDETAFRGQLEAILGKGKADTINQILGRLNPLARQAMKGQMFRQLAISAETRNFVKNNFDQIADKILRLQAEESPLGLGKLVMEPLSEEDIRQRTILQAVKELSEIYDLEKLELEVGGERFKNLTWEDYFKQWEKDSGTGLEIRAAAIDAFKNVRWKAMLDEIDQRLAENKESNDAEVMSLEMQKEAIEQTMKMLARIIDATNEGRPTDAAKRLELVTESRNVVNTGSMPGLLGALPQTTTRRFEGAPIPILRMAQLEQTAEVKQLRSLERGAQQADTTKAVFSDAELSRPLSPEDLADVQTYKGSMYDVPLASKPIYGLQDSPSPFIAAELLQAELTNFANQVGGVAKKYLSEGNFFKLYNTHRHYVAAQEAMKADTVYRDIAKSLSEKREQLLKDRPTSDALDTESFLNQSEDYVNLKLELDKAQDNALMVRNEVLAIDGSWAKDVEERAWSIMSMSGETLETVSNGRTWGEAVNKTALDNQRSGNMIAWLAPPAKTPGEVILDGSNTAKLRYEDKSETAMLPRSAHSVDASAGLYMSNYIQVTGWFEGLKSILKREPTSREITVFARWADAKARFDVDEQNKLLSNFGKEIAPYKDLTEKQLTDIMGRGQDIAAQNFRDANNAIAYMAKPVIREQVKESLKAQLGDDFEAKVAERTGGLTLEELMNFKRKLTDENTTIFVNPLGVVIAPHKVVGDGIVNLTMQERVLALQGIQNQTVVDRMRLATMFDRKLPMNSELSSRMGGYDPFTKFNGMTIDKARRNAAVLTDALEVLQGRRSTEKLSVAIDRRNVVRRGTLTEAPMKFVKFSNEINEEGAKDARMLLAENTLEMLPLSEDSLKKINALRNTFDPYDEADWANGIQVAMMVSKDSAYNVFKQRVLAEERLSARSRDSNPDEFNKQFDARWEKVKPIVDELRNELNILNRDSDVVSNFLNRNDVFFGETAIDSTTHETFNSLYSQKIKIEQAVQMELLNRTLVPDNTSFDREVQFIKPMADLNGIIPRSDGTQLKPNTIDARIQDYPKTDGHLMLTHRLDTFVNTGILNKDQASVLKLAFWNYDTEALGKIFDPMKTDSPLRFDVLDGVDYMGKYEQLNKAFTDGVVHRIGLLRNMSSKFDDPSSLGPAAVVLEEIGHALGHKLDSDTQINFIERVKKIEMATIEEAEKLLYGEGGPKNKKRLEQLREDFRRIKDMEIPENAAKRTELFGAMFALSGLHKAKNQWDTITDGAATQTALSDAHSIIKSLGKLADISGVDADTLNGKSLFTGVEETIRSSINLDVRLNKRSQPTDENRLDENHGPRHVDVDVAKRNEDIRRAKVEKETDDLIEQIRDPRTGQVDISLLGNADKMSVTVRDTIILRVMEDHVKRSTSGSRVDTPFSSYLSAMAFGKLTPNQVARYGELLSSPFGMRQFAFATDGEIPLTAAVEHLFNGADSQSYFTTGAFQDAMPTIQGLGLYLRGEFEKVIPALALLKGQNMTKGPLGPTGGETTPWSLYSTLWREMVMDYQGKDRAKEVLVNKLKSMKDNDPDFVKFLGNKKKSDEFLDIMADTADSWANPKEGLWASIVDSMVQAGMVKESKRNDLIANAAYPIKFKDSIFKNMTDIDGDTPRRELRRAMVDIVRGRMEHSEDVDIDILQIALADVLPSPSERRGKNLETYINNLPNEIQALLKTPEIKGNIDVLLGKIRRGDITLKDLGDDVRTRYMDTLKSDDLVGNEDPRKKAMLLELSEEFRNKLAKSQKTSTLDLQPTTAAEFVANRYMNNIGSSSYSFAGDAFLSPKQLWEDPRIAKFLEDDPISLLDSVKRGTAAQAFDRATYSNYFGIKGFGMKDLIELYKKAANGENTHHEFNMMFMTKDMTLDEHKRTMTHDERQKFKAGIDHIDSMYKYSVGTLSTLDNPHAAPFLSIINVISELGTALSIAPRLAIATAIEETPMSIGSVLKDNLLGAKREMQDVLAIAKSTKDIHETLEGLGHITSSVMHQAAALAAKMGDDGSGSYGVTDKKKIKQIYKFLSTGMNKQVMAARSLGAMQYVHRLDSIFSNIAGDISIKAEDTARGKSMSFMRQGTGGFHVNADEIYLRLQEQFDGDFTNITLDEFKKTTKELGIDEEISRDILEAVKMGLFEEDKYQFFRNMWVENREQILRTGVPFDKLRLKITADYDQHVRAGKDGDAVRTRKLQALNAIRELVFTASTKFAKQPSLSTQPLGARNAGVLATFFTRLTTYASSSANTLRRAMFVGPSTFAAAFTAHMITGWLYYKLIQLQGFRTIEEMKRELQKDPMGELTDAVMSVPFLGANQMVISMLLQMMRGERPVNSKPYDIAALNAANTLLQLPVRVTKAVQDIINGDWEKGTANLAQRMPVPHAWALAIALRNAGAFEKDVQIGRLSPKYRGQLKPQPIQPPARSEVTKNPINTSVLEPQVEVGKPQVTPEHTNPETGMTTPSSVEEDRVGELLKELESKGFEPV